MPVLLFDFGQGNLHSVEKALAAINLPVVRCADGAEAARVLDEAGGSGFLLPGVGAFGSAMEEIRARGLEEPIREAAREAMEGGRPLLGICVGLQVLFESSEELPGATGLGILAGRVRRFDSVSRTVPQIGWNEVVPTTGAPRAFEAFRPSAHAYFVHAYYPEPSDAGCVAAWTEYGVRYASAGAHGRLLAVQFHPEKSSTRGLALLRQALA